MAGVTDRIVPNSETGEVTVAVARGAETREYVLKLGMNALVQLQQRRKMPMAEIVSSFSKMDVESIRDMLFVMTRRHHKEDIKTVDQAGELLEDMGLHTFFAVFTEVMKNGASESTAANPPTAAIPTGDSST